MSTKTHIGQQEEAINEVGIEFGAGDPASPANTQTWVNTTVPVLTSDISYTNYALNKNTDPILLPALNLDAAWGKAYKIISSDSAFTFSNFDDGVKVELSVINSDLYNTHTISFPSIKFTNISNTNLILSPSETAIYTFTQTNSQRYCSVIKGINPLNQTWIWGENQSGQLGYNDTFYRSSPVLVIGNHSFVNVSCFDYALGLKIDGTAWSWGSNICGQLGLNIDTNNRSSPIQVVGNHSFIKLSTSGSINSLALKSDGSCWAWGHNTEALNLPGALGDNTTDNRSSPVAVVGAHSFINIATAAARSLALKSDGSIWSWGSDATAYGTSLGTNTINSHKSSPVLVAGSHSFINIASGDYHSLGLKIDGTVWGWGIQYSLLAGLTSGALGDNSTGSRTSPIQVAGAHSFIKIACGKIHSLGLKADSSLWAWGQNIYGQLGHNDTNYRSSPVQVVGSHSFISITGGNTNSLGLKSDGSCWYWGSLGGNNRSSPVQVIGNFSFTKIFERGGLVINPNNF